MKKVKSQNNDRRQTRTKKLAQISSSTAQIVRDAASLLDEEVAAGIVAARQVQQRFQKERRVVPDDFKTALQKFQGAAHEVVTLLNSQFTELKSPENSEMVKKFLAHTHDLLDLAVELVNTGAELTNQLIQKSPITRDTAGNASRKR